MSDNKPQTGGQVRQRINLTEDREVRDWVKKFGVSAGERQAAAKAGRNGATALHAHLASRPR